MKRVLVIGGGGREHAIVYALSKSKQVETIYCAPGNAGIAELATCVDIKDTDIEGLLLFAQETKIDLTVVGPEASLALGIVDAFRAEGLAIFGHTKLATQIESSKEYAKQIMAQYNVPTAAYESFDTFEKAWCYTQKHGAPIVLKYDGLAAGKGVVVAMNLTEAEKALRDMLVGEAYGTGKVVIEDYLEGPEFSFMAFVNNHNVYPMPLSQDHKRVEDGDKGPNTGGMGAYTPLPFISKKDEDYALKHILQVVADGMATEGRPLTGVLYGGLILTKDGIKVIEFNARFGDPETEVILPLLKNDAFDVFYAIATGEELQQLQWSNQATIGVVLASKGYPATYEKGIPITQKDSLEGMVFHMGTKMVDDQLTTAGGRVMMAIAQADTLQQAQQKVYSEIQKIQCSNLFYRKDIGHIAIDMLK